MIRVGYAKTTITPELGTHLAGRGAGVHRPAKKILDPLFARAMVVESDGRRMAILALDVICITEEYTRRIRETAAHIGFESDAVMVYAQQNHSAPSLGGLMLDPDFPFTPAPGTEYVTGSEPAYCEFAVERAIKVLKTAAKKVEPVEVAYGRACAPNLAFNRRGVTLDGSIVMPWMYSSKDKPLGPRSLRYMEGPDDPEVGVIAFRSQDLEFKGFLLNFACHPVNLFATKPDAVSADWPGAWVKSLGSAFGSAISAGSGAPALVLNGCCGNLNPWPPMTPDFKPDHRRMGAALADASARVIERLAFTDESFIDWRTRRVPLPYRDVPRERLKKVDEILNAHPEPVWNENKSAVDDDWFMAASTRSIEHCRKRMPEFLYEIQVFRIGDAFVVALPGEPFVEGQLAIKTECPLPFVQVAHMSSHYVGYIPTREGMLRGGHEANFLYTYWAKLGPESLDIIVQNVREMMAELV